MGGRVVQGNIDAARLRPRAPMSALRERGRKVDTFCLCSSVRPRFDRGPADYKFRNEHQSRSWVGYVVAASEMSLRGWIKCMSRAISGEGGGDKRHRSDARARGR